jgi:CTP synthase (UTP-ammonia lyase)
LVGKSEVVRISPNTVTHQAYDRDEAAEQFRCNFALSGKYKTYFLKGPLKVVGVDQSGEARVVELSDHPFFVATLFLPQLSSHPGAPHPLVVGFVRAAGRR